MNRMILVAMTAVILLIAVVADSPAAGASPLLSSTPPPGAVVIHLPFDTGPVSVTTSQDVWLKVGWAAATAALVKQAKNTIVIGLALDGSPLVIASPKQYWGPLSTGAPGPGVTCPGHPTIKSSLWYYDLGTLPAGTHTLNAVLSVKHPLNDGCYTNGVKDHYSGVYATDTVPISVSP